MGTETDAMLEKSKQRLKRHNHTNANSHGGGGVDGSQGPESGETVVDIGEGGHGDAEVFEFEYDGEDLDDAIEENLPGQGQDRGRPPGGMSWLEMMLVEYRWVFVVLFLLPVSLIFDMMYALRAWIVFMRASAPQRHAEKVRYVQKQVGDWIANGRSGGMCTARPGWQTISFRQPIYKNTLTKIKVNLVDVLEVDTERREVTVEPLVSMGQLSATLLPLGWIIPVLPELDDLTVGGLVMGTGIETSSHKFGLFQHICKAFEIVLADGQVLWCSAEENSDLFYSIPWSYGTLGFLTAVKIEIIPAKKFVKMEYFSVHSQTDACNLFRDKTMQSNDNEFVEAIMFSEHSGVVMVGNMVDHAESGKTNRIGLWYKPWFYKHVETFIDKMPGETEYIPLRHYFHRHSRSIFWEIREIIPFGNNPLFRYVLGWMVPPKVSLLKLTQPAAVKKLYEARHMIQDMLVPMNALQDSLSLFDEETGIYPLWLCPFVLRKRVGFVHPSGNEDEMFVDIGAYGVPTTRCYETVKSTRRIEEFVRSVKGFQMLYADTYMTAEEFREMFDHSLYDELRVRYRCEGAFPEVYDKVSRRARR